MDKRDKRDGKCLERIGSYDPSLETQDRIKLNHERLDYWVGKGAQISDRVKYLRKYSLDPENIKKREKSKLKELEKIKIKRAKKAEETAAAKPEETAKPKKTTEAKPKKTAEAKSDNKQEKSTDKKEPAMLEWGKSEPTSVRVGVLPLQKQEHTNTSARTCQRKCGNLQIEMHCLQNLLMVK